MTEKISLWIKILKQSQILAKYDILNFETDIN